MRFSKTRLLTIVMASGLTVSGAVVNAEEGVYRISDQVSTVSQSSIHNASSTTIVYGGTSYGTTSTNCLYGTGTTYGKDGCLGAPCPNPLRRAPVMFQRNWPQNWYGNGPAPGVNTAPMVYQPTDTTQLGFHYQRVPTWLPNPQMLPPAPFPGNYHSYNCRQGGCPTCPAGGQVIYTSPVQEPVHSPKLAPTPDTPPAPAPATLDKSAMNWRPARAAS